MTDITESAPTELVSRGPNGSDQGHGFASWDSVREELTGSPNGRLPADVDHLPTGARRCTASIRPKVGDDGEVLDEGRCMRAAIDGGNVCTTHGGNSPQVQRKAKLRMAALVDPAIDKLARILVRGKDSDAMRAAENILDRAGVPRRHDIDVEGARSVLLERVMVMRQQQQRRELVATLMRDGLDEDEAEERAKDMLGDDTHALQSSMGDADAVRSSIRAAREEARAAGLRNDAGDEGQDVILDDVTFDDPLAGI